MRLNTFACLLIQLLLLTKETIAYCWGAGQNPSFTGPPRLSQVDLFTVRVSWKGIVKRKQCADDFVVKYWIRAFPNQYNVTDLVKGDFTDIKVIPKIHYSFQAVAREDKGMVGGVDYNKSPIVDFKTTTSVSPIINPTKKDHPDLWQKEIVHDILYDGTR